MDKLKLHTIAVILSFGVVTYGFWLQYRVSALKTKLNTVRAELKTQQANYVRLDESIKALTAEASAIEQRLTQQKKEIARQPEEPLSAAVKKAIELISGGQDVQTRP